MIFIWFLYITDIFLFYIYPKVFEMEILTKGEKKLYIQSIKRFFVSCISRPQACCFYIKCESRDSHVYSLTEEMSGGNMLNIASWSQSSKENKRKMWHPTEKCTPRVFSQFMLIAFIKIPSFLTSHVNDNHLESLL